MWYISRMCVCVCFIYVVCTTSWAMLVCFIKFIGREYCFELALYIFVRFPIAKLSLEMRDWETEIEKKWTKLKTFSSFIFFLKVQNKWRIKLKWNVEKHLHLQSTHIGLSARSDTHLYTKPHIWTKQHKCSWNGIWWL